MEFKDVVAITSMPGLYKMINQRQDGMIVSSLETEKTQFVSNRRHQFSPLEGIYIYATNEDTALLDIFINIKKLEEDGTPCIPHNSDKASLASFFTKALPTYDKDRVYVSDIKKIIKWYHILKPFDIFKKEAPPEETTGTSEETTDAVDTKTTNQADTVDTKTTNQADTVDTETTNQAEVTEKTTTEE